LEREIYAAKDAATHNQAVAAKAAVRKQQGLYGEALAELGRIYTYALMGDELADYYAQGSSVIYYQHKARRTDPVYAKQLDELLESGSFPGAIGLALKFKTTSQRYYMFIIQPQHRAGVEATVNQMLSTAWSEHFCLL
jgi:hypothetical protein